MEFKKIKIHFSFLLIQVHIYLSFFSSSQQGAKLDFGREERKAF